MAEPNLYLARLGALGQFSLGQQVSAQGVPASGGPAWRRWYAQKHPKKTRNFNPTPEILADLVRDDDIIAILYATF